MLPLTGTNPRGWFDDVYARAMADALGITITICDVTTADRPLERPQPATVTEINANLKLLKCDVHFDLLY